MTAYRKIHAVRYQYRYGSYHNEKLKCAKASENKVSLAKPFYPLELSCYL
jgi:hypothetical protein